LALALAAAGWAYRGAPESYSHKLAARDLGSWVATHLPVDTVVGSWDAGIIAAHARRRVVHLEGAVSSTRGAGLEGVDAIAQRLSDGWLCSANASGFEGVSLREWWVVHAKAVVSRTLSLRGRRSRHHFVVLARDRSAESLAMYATRACGANR
jgi:hypothetical protein